MSVVMLVPLSSAMITDRAYAGSVAFGNSRYAYAKLMTEEEVTLVTEVTDGLVTSCQWYTSSEKNGTYSVVEDATSLELEFVPVDGNWYKCTVNDTISTIPVQLVKVGKEGDTEYSINATKVYRRGQWYVSNGDIAYTSIGDSDYTYGFDIIGEYTIDSTEHWINTSYGSLWSTYSSAVAEPTSADDNYSKLDSIKFAFSNNSTHTISVEADLEASEKAFAFYADVELASNLIEYDDAASLKAIYKNDEVKQIQMVGEESVDEATSESAAFVLKYIDQPSCYWIGEFSYGGCWIYNDNYLNYVTDQKDIDGVDVATEVCGADSEMSSSWMNVTPGGKVKFQFGVGSVDDTGASLAVTSTSDSESITIEEADLDFYYALYDTEGNRVSDWTNIANSDGNIVFDGLNNDANYVIKSISSDNYDSDNIDEIVSSEDSAIKNFNATTAINPISSSNENDNSNSAQINPGLDSITYTGLNSNYFYQLQDEEGAEITEWTAPDTNNTIVFSNLTRNTTYYLVAKSESNTLSDRIVISTFDKEDTPTAAIDYDNMAITGLDTNGVYIINEKEYSADANGKISLEPSVILGGLEIIKKGSSANVLNSDQQDISDIKMNFKVNSESDFKIKVDNLQDVFIKANRSDTADKGVTDGDIAELQRGGKIDVNLNISNTNDEEKQKIFTTVDKTKYSKGEFFNIDISKLVTNGSGEVISTTKLNELGSLIKLTLELKDEIPEGSICKTYRVHNGQVDELTDVPNVDGEFIKVISKNKVELTVKKFSTYYVTYSVKEETVAKTNTESVGTTAPNTSDYSNNLIMLVTAIISTLGMAVCIKRFKLEK